MQTILSLDKHYQPHRWVDIEEAIILESKGQVLDHLGERMMVYHGGINRMTGIRSVIKTNSIIVIDGAPNFKTYTDPALTNLSLFQRDLYMCAYCGYVHRSSELTRDHIHPVSKGGRDTWMNVVTACRDCNSLKGNILPGQRLPHRLLGPQLTGFMDILYVPYVPCKVENLIMRNRNVKIDQMQFLLDRVKNRKSRIFDYARNIFGSDISR